jgi:putative phosphoesterase
VKALRVGLVSDTHGLFEPRLVPLLDGCALILHAGDVVKASILVELARLAPVHAVRGNNDGDPAFDALPEVAHLDLAGRSTVVIHEIGSRARLATPARRAVARHAARIVVHGHSHRPGAAQEGGVLFVNPGSAGPRRFSLPRAAGILLLRRREVEVRLHDVADDALPLLAPPQTFAL